MCNHHCHIGHSKVLLPEKLEDFGCYLLLPPFQQKESENCEFSALYPYQITMTQENVICQIYSKHEKVGHICDLICVVTIAHQTAAVVTGTLVYM
jgi:hypothetical protein